MRSFALRAVLAIAAGAPAAASEFAALANRAANASAPEAKIELYGRALEAWSPKDGASNKAVVLANRAALLHNIERYEEALRDLDASMSLSGDNPIALANKGAALSRLGRGEEAVEAFTRAIRMEPRNPIHYASRAVANDALGRTEEAILDYDVLLSIDPAFRDGRKTRGSLHFKLGDHEKAIADFEAAIAANKKDRRAYQLLALAREAIEVGRKNAEIAARNRELERRNQAARGASSSRAARPSPPRSDSPGPLSGIDARIWLAAGGLLLLGIGIKSLR
jgi:tetratricopeptide (TPR) repeat protein